MTQILNDVDLDNLYTLARRARNNNDIDGAQKYYDMILIKDPDNWEPAFYTVFYQSMNCKLDEISSACYRIANCEQKCLMLIKDNYFLEAEQKSAVSEMLFSIMAAGNHFMNESLDNFNEIESSIRQNYIPELSNRLLANAHMLYNFGDCVIEMFGKEYSDIACKAWKQGIIVQKSHSSCFDQNDISRYSSKINEYEPDYTVEINNTKPTEGKNTGVGAVIFALILVVVVVICIMKAATS